MIVYWHKTSDTAEIFYVGIASSLQRVHAKGSRSNFWKNVENKHGRVAEIVAKDLSLSAAIELEKFLIKEIGRRDLCTGNLVNLTAGGEGIFEASPELKDRMNKHKFGQKFSEDWKMNISKSLSGKKLSESHVLKMASSLRGKKQPIEYVLKRAASNLGKKRSAEAVDNMRGAARNRKKPSPEARARMTIAARLRAEKRKLNSNVSTD
jgi:hypothetical protein